MCIWNGLCLYPQSNYSNKYLAFFCINNLAEIRTNRSVTSIHLSNPVQVQTLRNLQIAIIYSATPSSVLLLICPTPFAENHFTVHINRQTYGSVNRHWENYIKIRNTLNNGSLSLCKHFTSWSMVNMLLLKQENSLSVYYIANVDLY